MSRKKITLKDLDAFLKQQAASFVNPEKLSDKIEDPKTEEPELPTIEVSELSFEKVLHELRALAKREGDNFRAQFYDVIIKTIESQPVSTPEDKMLINTALFLKNGDQWKESIRDYWKNKKG